MEHKIFLAAAVGAVFAFNACSTDSSPSNASSSDSIAPISQGGGDVVPASSASSAVALASGASVLYPQNLFTLWKAFHYVDEETEMTYYPSIASDFSYVFPSGGAGRIKWSVQTGTYKTQCTVDDATEASLKKRACTVSEGIGYGMLIAAFQKDYDMFNRLWVYNKGFRTYSGSTLMPWINYSFHYNSIDISSATDADLDIATALILVYYQTGVVDYLNDALAIAAAIWNEEVNPANLLLYSGNTSMWTTNPTYNLSYFSPVALRLFALVDPNHNWAGVLDAEYAYMQQVQAAGTGVFPDWSDASGNAVEPANNSSKYWWTFDKESVRIPWRIAWDYYWFQDARAAAVLNTLNAFITTKSNGDPAQIPGTSYSWNLSVGADKDGSTLSSMWLGAWCATGLAGNSAWLESCTNYLNAKELTNSASSYYTDILLLMYSQLLNGMYTKPF
jgi:hypothetical protein